jgi:cell division protein FtsL
MQPELTISLVTLAAVIIGVAWNSYQWRIKVREEKRKEIEEAETEATWRANLKRDISQLSDSMNLVNNILGNGNGLKHDVQTVKQALEVACETFNTTRAEINGRIDVVETRLEDHIKGDGHEKEH